MPVEQNYTQAYWRRQAQGLVEQAGTELALRPGMELSLHHDTTLPMRSPAVEGTETPTVAALQRENVDLRAAALHHGSSATPSSSPCRGA